MTDRNNDPTIFLINTIKGSLICIPLSPSELIIMNEILDSKIRYFRALKGTKCLPLDTQPK